MRMRRLLTSIPIKRQGGKYGATGLIFKANRTGIIMLG